MAKVKVRLTHTSHLSGAEGNPGDEVSVDQERADKWVAAKGCVVVEDEPAKGDSPKPAAKQPAKPAAAKE